MKDLFAEAKIGSMTLQNRFVRSATWLALADEDGAVTPELIDKTVELARANLGLIIAGFAYISSDGQTVPRQPGIDRDDRIPGLASLVDAVHDAGGKIACQIYHGGVFRSPLLPQREMIGPSPLTVLEEPQGRSMALDEIACVIDQYAAAARRAVEADFDAVQIHAAHGFLLSQFLSPFFNHRTDAYGGNLVNRARLLIETVRAVRKTVPHGFPVMLKINTSDMVHDGFDIDQMLDTIGMVEGDGIDGVELSGGTLLGWSLRNPAIFFSPMGADEIYYENAAKRFKARFSIPLILVGGVREKADAQRLVDEGIADFVSLSRPLIREPDLVTHWQSGNDKTADCISCNGCFNPVLAGRSVYCIHKRGYRKMNSLLRFFSGSSASVNSRRAVHECLENAFGEVPIDCDLIIVYTTIGHDIEAIVDEIKVTLPGVQIAGCTGAGIIGREGPNESMRALGIMAVKGNDFAVACDSPESGTLDFDVGVKMAKELRKANPNINMILLHPSLKAGLLNNGAILHRMIEGIESVFGADIPIVGGVSVDNNRAINDYQFTEQKVVEQGYVAVGFADPAIELVTQANHGFSVIGEPFKVTKADKSRVYEFDGVRAWKRLTESLGLTEMASRMEVVAFGELAEELPEELRREYGNKYIIRAGGMFTDSEGCCYLTVPVEVGTKLWLVKRDEEAIINGIDWMTSQLHQKLGKRRPMAVFHADCGARGRQLFNQMVKEEVVQRLQRPICGDEHVPWLGLYAAGELTPLGGKNLIHTFTSSLYAIVERES